MTEAEIMRSKECVWCEHCEGRGGEDKNGDLRGWIS